jgi:hypothetical protein
MGLEVCYCSVFERCWTNSSIQVRHPEGPIPVPRCESSDDFLSTFFFSDDADANEGEPQ